MKALPVVMAHGAAVSVTGAAVVDDLSAVPEGAVVIAPAGDCAGLGDGWFRARTVIILGESPAPEGDPFLVLPGRPSPAMLERAIAAARRCADDATVLEAAAERLAAERRLRHELLEIGAALSAEPDLDRLLEHILRSARQLVHADAGSLYLLEGTGEDGYRLRFLLAQNDSCSAPAAEGSLAVDTTSIAGYVALTGRVLSIPDAEAIPGDAPYSFNRSFDIATGYTTRSVLAVPMSDRRNRSVGVLQLINRKRDPSVVLQSREDVERQVVPFTDRDRELLRALASQAAVVIENSRLVLEIQRLFEAFVRAVITAIEQRDPPTSGHSARVAIYSVNLARALELDPPETWAGITFSADAIRQLRYAALLHDVGKLGVREQVLTKATKLYPFQDRVIRERFLHARRALQLAAAEELLHGIASGAPAPDDASLPALEETLRNIEHELEGAFETVQRANDPTVPLDGLRSRLEELARRYFPGPRGEPRPLLEPDELRLLSLDHGNLDEDERREIQFHVVHSTRFLQTLPWPRTLERVPEIVALHHEKLDGSGYPGGVSGASIPLEVRILSIADIYDALTASDRPYRDSLSPERALEILRDEAAGGGLDADLVALFERSSSWRLSGSA